MIDDGPLGTAQDDALAGESARDRYRRGEQVLHAINGDIGTQFVEALAEVSPDLAHDIVAHGFGDVYSRPDLTPPQRQLVTLGMLTALGGCEPQLKVHVETSLNVGLSPEQVVGALSQASIYCGFPKALNAVFVAKQVFQERGLLPLAPARPDAT